MGLKDFSKPKPHKNLGRIERIELELKAAGEFGVHLTAPIPEGEKFRVSRRSAVPPPWPMQPRMAEIIARNDSDVLATAKAPSEAVGAALAKLTALRPDHLRRSLRAEIQAVDSARHLEALPRLSSWIELLAAVGLSGRAMSNLVRQVGERVFAGVKFHDMPHRSSGGEPPRAT